MDAAATNRDLTWPACRPTHREHLRRLTTREVNVNHTVTKNTPGSWRDAALAGLPHVLFALALYAPLLTYNVTAHGLAVFFDPLREYTRNSDTFPRFWLQALLQAFWALTVILTVVGLPRWSASWIGYALHGLLGMLLQLPGYVPALALSWLALIVGVVFWLSRRDPLAGLLAVLPLAPMLVWLIQITRRRAFDWTLLSRSLYLALPSRGVK